MKILHGPQNIGGMAGVLARAQRACGEDAWSYCLPTGNFRYFSDQVIGAEGSGDRAWEIGKFLLRKGLGFDAFQFYFGTAYTGLGLHEIPLLKRFGKKIYFYFCGCDVRDSKRTIAQHEYSACAECWPMLCSPNRKIAVETAKRYAIAIFVSTPDLLEFVPGSVLLPQPIDMEDFGRIREDALREGREQEKRAEGTIRIAHAPSSRAIKGSKFLVRAVEALQARGLPVELIMIEGKPYSEAMRICSRADIVVDQLLIGAYGQFAVEMMALGKPVVCYLREDLRSHYPDDLPIVSANPSDIESVLEGMIADRGGWDCLGAQGLEYVRRVHDSHVVARQALAHY